VHTDIVRVYRNIHSWVGIICGLALFIAFYAGALTMFEVPLQRWATPPVELPAPPPLDATQALVDATLGARPEAARTWHVNLAINPETPARVSWPQSPQRSRDEGNPVDFGAAFGSDGEWVAVRLEPAPVAELLDRLHRQVGLPLPHEFAMWITGTVALLYGVAIIAGLIVLLPTLQRDLFALRLGASTKRLWLDAHNALGVMSLPFHLVMVLTVVVFAFHDVFYATQNAVVYDGDLPQQWAQGWSHRPVHPAEAKPLQPHEIVERIAAQAPGFMPTRLEYSTDGEGRLSARVLGTDPRYVLRAPTFGFATVDPYDGRLLQTDFLPGHQPVASAIVANFFGLHFGNYGGPAVRWAYFVLGLAGTGVFYTGNLLWIESRRRLAKRDMPDPLQDRSARALGGLTVGVALGCITGISATLAATKWLPGRVDNPGMWHEGIYHIVFLVAIVWAFLRGPARSAVDLLHTAAFATALIPLSSLMALARPEFGLWNTGGSTIAVDAVALTGTLVFLALGRRTHRRLIEGPGDSVWS
jgi:uncharacterized iron-regulated membrane protein